MEDGEYIKAENLPDTVSGISKTIKTAEAKTDIIPEVYSGNLKEQISQAERAIIERTLQETGDSLIGKRKAAENLGISESTLYRRLRALGMLKQEKQK